MAGLVPAIHDLLCSNQEDVDARHKAGHDERNPHPGIHSWQSGLTDASLSSPARAMVWDGRMRWGWQAAAPRWWSTISAARATAPAGRCRRAEPWVPET